MGPFSIEMWIAFQMIIDVVLIVLVLFSLKNLKLGMGKDASKAASARVIKMIEPLLKEADSTAKAFERHLEEKNQIIAALTEKLDNRIISLNLLLNRSETALANQMPPKATPPRTIPRPTVQENPHHEVPAQTYTEQEPEPAPQPQANVYDQQEAILKEYQQGLSPAKIAQKLSMPQGEVDLVIDLKMKLHKLRQEND